MRGFFDDEHPQTGDARKELPRDTKAGHAGRLLCVARCSPRLTLQFLWYCRVPQYVQLPDRSGEFLGRAHNLADVDESKNKPGNQEEQ